MPIVVNKTETRFAGRVLKVNKFMAHRNMSDTLDYSDWRTVECCKAFVWLGTHAVPPNNYYGEPTTTIYAQDSTYTASLSSPCYVSRELKAEEQFAWIDCSNHFVWRGEDHLDPTVDEILEEGAVAALPVWEAHQKVLAEATAKKLAAEKAEQEEQNRIEAEKAAAMAAKKAAKLDASKAAADAEFARLPAKGTIVTVGNFTGTLFWTGIKAYRGQYNCRVGVKDSKGNVEWANARDVLVAEPVSSTDKTSGDAARAAAVARLKAAV